MGWPLVASVQLHWAYWSVLWEVAAGYIMMHSPRVRLRQHELAWRRHAAHRRVQAGAGCITGVGAV